MPVVRKVSAKVSRSAGRYLVVPDIHPVFQIRVPRDLAACRNVPPLRVSLGPVSRRQARRLADELAVMARRLFDEGRRMMEMNSDSNVGSPEWLATIRHNLIAGLARLQNPPPSPAHFPSKVSKSNAALDANVPASVGRHAAGADRRRHRRDGSKLAS